MLALAPNEKKENSSFDAAASGSYEGAIRRSDAVDRRAAVHLWEGCAHPDLRHLASALGYELGDRASLVGSCPD